VILLSGVSYLALLVPDVVEGAREAVVDNKLHLLHRVRDRLVAGACEKTPFLSNLCIKTIILPRQARDKHKEPEQKGRFRTTEGLVLGTAEVVHLRKPPSFLFNFSLRCLSRACLGKCSIVSTVKWHRKKDTRFRTPISGCDPISLHIARYCVNTVPLVLSFPYVCPEPVLFKFTVSFLYTKLENETPAFLPQPVTSSWQRALGSLLKRALFFEFSLDLFVPSVSW
jgi:hypothetical protein